MFTRIFRGVTFLFCLVLFPNQLNAVCRKVVTQSNYSTVFSEANQKYEVKSSIDLNGKVIALPKNIAIEFGRKGKIVNGSLVGDGTKLINVRSGSLGVICKGTWAVTEIKDSYFESAFLSDNQILENISRIQSDEITNSIYLEKPQYRIGFSKDFIRALSLSSNTKLYMRSKLCVLGNDLPKYAVISVGKKKNIIIRGGEIEGDVGNHKYASSTDQWGFGIQLSRAEDVLISDMKITKCMGDGIYIGGGDGKYLGDYSEASKNIHIQNVISDDNRRQGISITYAYDVVLKDCVFSNTGKTEFVSPGCGIDIEPNPKQSVGKVVVNGCSFLHNDRILDVSIGGYRVEGDKCNVEEILFENCNVTGILSVRTGSAIIRDCTMGTLAIHLGEMPKEKVYFERCKINSGNGITVRTSCVVTRDEYLPIYNCKDCEVSVEDIRTKAIISTISHKGNEKGVLSFTNCSFSMPVNSQNYDLVQEKCVYDFSFEKCNVNSGGRVLHNRGFSFSRCTLNCSYVDLSPSRNACVVEDCTINASDSQRSIVLSPTSIQSQKPLYVVKRNSIVGGVEKSIVTKGINKARYDISGNEHSRQGRK